MAITYDAISTTTVTGSAASITFSSIPGTYTDLILVVQGGATAGSNVLELRFNSDSGTNYSYGSLYGTSSTGIGSISQTVAYTTASSGGVTNGLTYLTLFGYSQTTLTKTYLSRTANVASSVFGGGLLVGRWNSTSAITSITIYGQSVGTLIVGTMATLYGITRA